jgi:hypothetical protein
VRGSSGGAGFAKESISWWGGETNPIVHTTDYVYYKTASVDKWVLKTGIKLDKTPLRMPACKECDDGLCFTGQK